jgi:hypothetical protein
MILFAHPKCPCTEATMEELNRILAHAAGNVTTHVLFLKPAGFSDDWLRSSLWEGAAAIPGVAVREDSAGAEARIFGAETSGYLVVYAPNGKLLYKGGITGSRGHAGDNAGADAVISLLAGTPGLPSAPVFGCSLLKECQSPATPWTK